MTEELAEIWQQTLMILKKEMAPHSYHIWIKSTRPLRCNDTYYEIEVPNDFAKEFMETRYHIIIKNTICQITKRDLEIIFTVALDNDSQEQDSFVHEPATITVIEPEKPKLTFSSEENSCLYLNNKYTFDSFVIGNSNRFVHGASLAVAESPAKAYNPFFIYGGVGLGKTHLMHAIGHHVLSKNPNVKVLYVSSEKFTNEMINALTHRQMTEFRNLYRNIDILLIDDIQFLAKKEATQEEFFHTFNTLYEASKQIIISSDRPPKEIPTLEDRLRSRFEWGLIADIQPPDLETRIAILRKKANSESLDVPNEVLMAIASRVDSNIRELEGALIRVVAYASVINKQISVELVEEVLKGISSSRSRNISIPVIQQIVSGYYNLKIEELSAKKRTQAVAFPRQIAMYLSREMTSESLPRIGEAFGGRDHTTVIHACDKIAREMREDPRLQITIKELTAKIENP